MNDMPYFTACFDMFMWSLILAISICVLMSFAWQDGYEKCGQDRLEKQMDEDGI